MASCIWPTTTQCTDLFYVVGEGPPGVRHRSEQHGCSMRSLAANLRNACLLGASVQGTMVQPDMQSVFVVIFCLVDFPSLRGLGLQSLRARLRHAERQHKEQMDLERRQQNAAAEGTRRGELPTCSTFRTIVWRCMLSMTCAIPRERHCGDVN